MIVVIFEEDLMLYPCEHHLNVMSVIIHVIHYVYICIQFDFWIVLNSTHYLDHTSNQWLTVQRDDLISCYYNDDLCYVCISIYGVDTPEFAGMSFPDYV